MDQNFIYSSTTEKQNQIQNEKKSKKRQQGWKTKTDGEKERWIVGIDMSSIILQKRKNRTYHFSHIYPSLYLMIFYHSNSTQALLPPFFMGLFGFSHSPSSFRDREYHFHHSFLIINIFIVLNFSPLLRFSAPPLFLFFFIHNFNFISLIWLNSGFFWFYFFCCEKGNNNKGFFFGGGSWNFPIFFS